MTVILICNKGVFRGRGQRGHYHIPPHFNYCKFKILTKILYSLRLKVFKKFIVKALYNEFILLFLLSFVILKLWALKIRWVYHRSRSPSPPKSMVRIF